MATEKTLVEKTTPLVETPVTPPENGEQPAESGNEASEIQKAITLVELRKDLAGLTQGLSNLQKQVIAQMGAIQYIQQKIGELTKEAKP